MEKASESSSPSKPTRRTLLLSFLGVACLIGLIVGLTVPVGGSNEEGGGGSVISNLFNRNQCSDPCVPGTEDIMSQKAHGTSEFPVVRDLVFFFVNVMQDSIDCQTVFRPVFHLIFFSIYVHSNPIFSGDATLISPTEFATSIATMPNFLGTGKPPRFWRTSNPTLTPEAP